jgi:hypothetical protein
MEAAAFHGLFLGCKRRRHARLVGRHYLGSKSDFLDQCSHSASRTASIAALPSMSQRATFICNATPIAHLPYFHFSANRLFTGHSWLGKFGPIQGCALHYPRYCECGRRGGKMVRAKTTRSRCLAMRPRHMGNRRPVGPSLRSLSNTCPPVLIETQCFVFPTPRLPDIQM